MRLNNGGRAYHNRPLNAEGIFRYENKNRGGLRFFWHAGLLFLSMLKTAPLEARGGSWESIE